MADPVPDAVAAARLFLFRPVLEVRGGMVGLELPLVDVVIL